GYGRGASCWRASRACRGGVPGPDRPAGPPTAPGSAGGAAAVHARRERQAVDLLVLGLPGVAAGPGPADLVALLELQQALPQVAVLHRRLRGGPPAVALPLGEPAVGERLLDRKSTRLNSSHVKISYAV